jgi:hypothetical protein
MRGRAHFGAFAFVAALIASSAEIAEAQTLRTFTVGHWNAGAYGKDGRFSYCAAAGTYKSGITMRFAIDRQYRWSVGFMHRDWTMPRGMEFDVALEIDDGQPIYVRARAVDATRALMQLADSVALFDRFRRGRVLRVSTRSHMFSLELESSSAMLAQLHDCVRRYTQPVNVANPFDGKRRATSNPREAIENPALQAEAAVLLANVMAAANVSGYAMGSPEEAAKMGAHAFWTGPSVVGSLLIIPVRRVDDPEIPGLVTGINAMGCKGAFMSGSIPSDGAREVRVTTTCQPSGQPLSTTYYFGIPRPRGGLYLFATRTRQDGNREDAERADEMIRQATYRTVN